MESKPRLSTLLQASKCSSVHSSRGAKPWLCIQAVHIQAVQSSSATMRRTLHILVAGLAVDAFAPTPASVRRRHPLYSKLPKRLRTSDLDAEGRCDEAGIVVK